MSNDLKNQPFAWDLLLNLYSPDLCESLMNLNPREAQVNSIFSNFLISYAYENGKEILQNKDQALKMYKYNADQLFDPLSCYRLAEIWSLKSDMNISPDFKQTWYYLLMFSGLIEPIYDFDFFKGTEWLMRVLKQADPSFTNSHSLIKDLISLDLDPLSDVIIDLLLLKLNIKFENLTNQQRYNSMIDKLTNILESPHQQSPNLRYCSYNLLFGISLRSFTDVSQRQYPKILATLCNQIELTLNKAQELSREAYCSKFQNKDNIFTQRLRRSIQQLFWIRFNIKYMYSKQTYNQNGIGLSIQQSLSDHQIEQIGELDEMMIQIIQALHSNPTITIVGELVLLRRLHARLLIMNNTGLEDAYNILQQEYTLGISNKNTQAFTDNLISKLFLKIFQTQKKQEYQQQAIEYCNSSYQKYNSRIEQEQNDHIIILESLFYKGKIELKQFEDSNIALKTFTEALNLYIEQFAVFNKETTFQFILLQMRIIKNILKISSSTSIIDGIAKKADQLQIQLYFPKNYKFSKSKLGSPTNSSKQSPSKTYSFGRTMDFQFNQSKQNGKSDERAYQDIEILGQRYQMCLSEEDFDIISQRDNISPNASQLNFSMSTLANSKANIQQSNSELNLGGILSSYESVKQYNIQLNLDDQFVFDLTKQYALNDCKMVQLECKDFKMKGIIKKGDLGAVYGIRYNNEYYAAKVITYISKKQFQQLQEFQLKLPHCLNLLNILGYATSTNSSGAINLYLISEMKRSNLETTMHKNELIRVEQKIKIIRQLLDCVFILHKNNIYHSNIKDTNILLDIHCNVYLSDLAITRVLKDFEFGENAFKQPYASPEQIQEDEPKNGKPSDMWAVGIIALQLFTNINKFTTQKIEELCLYSKVDFKLSTLSSSPIPELHKLENQIGLFIESFLRYEPKKRITAQQAVKDYDLIETAFKDLKKQKS